MIWASDKLFQELEEVPMTMIGGLDVHRQQITFDYVDSHGLVRFPTRLPHHVLLPEAPDGLNHNIFASPSPTEYAADPRRDGLITASRQGDGTENHSHPGQERSPNDVAEPMETKIQPAKGNGHHASNHQGRRQGLHNTASSDRDARSDDSEQRADPGHVPGRKRMMLGTQ
jgi:hypothetical protein